MSGEHTTVQPTESGEAGVGPHLTYGAMLRHSAAMRPDADALLIDGVCLTYAALLERGNARARELKRLGLRSGDRLGLLLPSSVALVEILIGAAMLGVVTVPMNTRFKTWETAHIVANSQMAAIYTTDAMDGVTNFKELLRSTLPGLDSQADPLALAIKGFPYLKAVVLIGSPVPGFADAAALGASAAVEAAPDPRDEPGPAAPFLLMYTSGTTANPKACIISSRAFLSTAHALADRYSITQTDVWWCPLPMFHVGGLLFMSLTLSRGGFYVGMGHFDVETTFDLAEQFRPTIFYPLFPPITLVVMDHPRFARTSFDAVRFVFSVATPDVQRKIQSAFPNARLCSAYGLTEACGAVTFSLPDDTEEQRLTTGGSPLPGWDFRVIDIETGRPAAPGTAGEIEIRGVGLFDGYYNDPAATAAAFTADGYFRTGDVGSVDKGGRLSFRGRFKDQLKIGGENVSALEVESFLCSHPAIKQAQVVGVPDERYGEVAGAFIELMSDAILTEQEVLEYCTGRIARYKVPRYVRIVTEWPMSATKVQKHRLRDALAAEVGAA